MSLFRVCHIALNRRTVVILRFAVLVPPRGAYCSVLTKRYWANSIVLIVGSRFRMDSAVLNWTGQDRAAGLLRPNRSVGLFFYEHSAAYCSDCLQLGTLLVAKHHCFFAAAFAYALI